MATNKAPEPLRLIQFQRELVSQKNIDELPKALRGIYVLYRTVPNDTTHPYRNVVYVGMSANGIKGRLRMHKKKKENEWDCCSVFAVWPNVRVDEIRELEGILRHIFRWDSDAQKLNTQGAYLRLLHTPKLSMSETNRRQKEYVDKDAVDDEIVPEPRNKTVLRKMMHKKAAGKPGTTKQTAGKAVLVAKLTKQKAVARKTATKRLPADGSR